MSNRDGSKQKPEAGQAQGYRLPGSEPGAVSWGTRNPGPRIQGLWLFTRHTSGKTDLLAGGIPGPSAVKPPALDTTGEGGSHRKSRQQRPQVEMSLHLGQPVKCLHIS